MKPIIKWVGGKTQILDKVLKTFPREIENYHELYVETIDSKIIKLEQVFLLILILMM